MDRSIWFEASSADGRAVNDVEITLSGRAEALAQVGEVLGAAGVAPEGGGMWSGTAHYLVGDGEAARRALEAAGFAVAEVSDVVVVPLHHDIPGQLGRIARVMADTGVRIRVQYSDHENRKILVVDDVERAREVAAAWSAGGV